MADQITNNYPIYMRDDLQDTGTIPSGAASACKSPDIVPYGIRIDQNPENLIYGPEWGQVIDYPLTAQQRNYIYVRGHSREFTNARWPVKGHVSLYYVPSCLFMTPNVWKQNLIGDGVTFYAENSDQRLLGSEPFTWTPPTSNIHYCLVARVATPDMPNPIPDSFANNGEFIQWVVNDPAVAWHNLIVDTNRTGSRSYDLSFGNDDNHSINVVFAVKAKNFPIGSKIIVQSDSAILGHRPMYEERTVEDGELELFIRNTVASSPDDQGLLTVLVVPNGEIPRNAKLEIQYFVQEIEERYSADDASHELLAPYAKTFKEHGLGGDPDYLDSPAVLLGEVTVDYQQGVES